MCSVRKSGKPFQQRTERVVTVTAFIRIIAGVQFFGGSVAQIIRDIINDDDAGLENAIHIITVIIPAIRDDHAIHIGLAVFVNAVKRDTANGALQNAVCYNIGMSGCGNGRTPIHDGTAGLAIGAVRITGFVAGGRLIQNGKFRIVCMPRFGFVTGYSGGFGNAAAEGAGYVVGISDFT